MRKVPAQLFAVVSLQDEVLPHDLHPRLGLPVEKTAGVVRVLHLPCLLSQTPPQLGPLPLLGVESVEPDLGQDQDVHGDLEQGSVSAGQLYCQVVWLVYLEGAADKELRRSFPEDKVSSFEDVSTGPHDHHGQTHAIGGLVLKISVKLRNSETGFSKDCHKANRFHKPGEVDQEVHEEGSYKYKDKRLYSVRTVGMRT